MVHLLRESSVEMDAKSVLEKDTHNHELRVPNFNVEVDDRQTFIIFIGGDNLKSTIDDGNNISYSTVTSSEFEDNTSIRRGKHLLSPL